MELDTAELVADRVMSLPSALVSTKSPLDVVLALKLPSLDALIALTRPAALVAAEVSMVVPLITNGMPYFSCDASRRISFTAVAVTPVCVDKVLIQSATAPACRVVPSAGASSAPSAMPLSVSVLAAMPPDIACRRSPCKTAGNGV